MTIPIPLRLSALVYHTPDGGMVMAPLHADPSGTQLIPSAQMLVEMRAQGFNLNPSRRRPERGDSHSATPGRRAMLSSLGDVHL